MTTTTPGATPGTIAYTATVLAAADALLECHAATGLDLTTWPEVMALVALVHPDIVVEGGSSSDATNSITSPEGWGETGRYWLDGATDEPCNEDAYAVTTSARLPLSRTL